jgi:pyrophosphatase PpaX
MRYPYVLFDLDGTLIDTNELILRSFEHALEVHAPGQYTREMILPHMGHPLRMQMEHFVPGQVEEAIRTYRAFNLEQHDAFVVAFPHAEEVLRRLHEDGCKIAIVTSKMRMTTDLGLKRCRLEPYIDVKVCVEDVKRHKPHPEPVQKALDLLGASAEKAIMVGDSPYDIQAGQAAGTATVGVKWSLRGEAGLKPFQPDYLVDDLLELERIVRGEAGV